MIVRLLPFWACAIFAESDRRFLFFKRRFVGFQFGTDGASDCQYDEPAKKKKKDAAATLNRGRCDRFIERGKEARSAGQPVSSAIDNIPERIHSGIRFQRFHFPSLCSVPKVWKVRESYIEVVTGQLCRAYPYTHSSAVLSEVGMEAPFIFILAGEGLLATSAVSVRLLRFVAEFVCSRSVSCFSSNPCIWALQNWNSRLVFLHVAPHSLNMSSLDLCLRSSEKECIFSAERHRGFFFFQIDSVLEEVLTETLPWNTCFPAEEGPSIKRNAYMHSKTFHSSQAKEIVDRNKMHLCTPCLAT